MGRRPGSSPAPPSARAAARRLPPGPLAVAVALATVVAVLPADPAGAQELSDFDYENLSFRGIALEGGYIQPSRVDPAPSVGIRADLGYLGPGVRIVGGLSRWSSALGRAEVERLEERLVQLISEQQGEDPTDVTVDLGEVTWSDVAISLDTHMVWAVQWGFLTYAGLGATAHVMSGGGSAVEDTFVEDLLDSVRAGVNVHGGVEVPVHRRLRLYGVSRFEVLEDLNYLEFRVGGQVHWGDLVEGEEG